jgi:NAD(P)-dependent dehydrogenase (short-subunit alcohol dehydrogenase family)
MANKRYLVTGASSGLGLASRQLADEFYGRYDRLNGLLNCAGIRVFNRRTTEDGSELMFGSEYLGHFLLTNLLVTALITGAPARVVTISGEGHKAGVEGGVGARINFDDIQYEKKWDVMRASKQVVLAKILFTYELARRLEGTGVVAHTVSPRFTRTNLSIHYPLLIRGIAKFQIWRAKAVSPEIGAGDVSFACAPVVWCNGQILRRGTRSGVISRII